MAAKSPRGNELAELEQDIFRARTSSNALKSLLSECKQDEETSRSVSRSTSHLGSRATSRATSPRLSSREPTLSSDELAPEIRVVRNPVAVRSAAPRPPSSTASASENGTSNGHSPPTTPLNGGVARWSDSQPAPGSVDMPPAQQAERATGAIDVTTIKSLKDTIESLLRDLNKAINERDTAMQEIARLAAQLAAAQADDHGEFLRMEVKSLRENKKHLEDALHTAVQDHKKELQELRQRFVDEMERSSQDKSVAIEDIEQSYSEALRAAQARTSEAREETRKANERSEQLTRDLEAVRAQLRQVESDRAFQVSSLEDERRQFNRFREDALKKHADLTDKNLENERHISQTETKLRAAQMELGAQKQEHERAADKMRQEMETLMQSRDTARSNASTLRRELDSSNEDILEWKRAAAKLEKELRDVLEAKKSSDAAAAAFQDKLAVVERARAQELEDLAQIKAALVAHQREHAATQERAKSRLQKVRDAIQPDTLFVQFNRPPSLEHTNARGGDDVAEGVANAQAPTAADQRKDAGVARELARRGEEEEEEEEAPVVLQRKEQSRATRAAAPPQRRSELPPPAATAEAGGGRPRSPSAPLAGKPPISPPSAGLGNLSLLGPSPPPAPETGAGWFPHQRTTPEASLDARKAVLLPRAGTTEQGEIEDVFLEAPVRALADIYVVSARDAPMEHQHRQMHVHTRVGWQAVVTRGVGAGEGTERGSRAWHSNFRCASSDPQNDIVIFDVEVLLGEGEERKQGAPVAVMPDGQRWEQVGRVAVPLSRVLVTGKEAGWYEVRSLMGAPIFTSPGVPFRLQIGCAAAAVSTDIQRKPLKAGVLYCMSERGAWEHRHALLDPYSQLLFLSEERLLLPEIMVEGSPSCVSVRTGTASFDAKEPRRFVVHNEEGQSVSFCGITADSASDWLDCLEISGCHIADDP